MSCGKIHVDQYACVGCSYKSCKALLLGVGLVCLLVLLLGAVEEHDGHGMIRSTAVLTARRSMVVENMKLQVVLEDKEKKLSEEETNHHMTQYRSPSPAAPANEIVGISYMNKRRVPNGADPIHNKSVGKSRRSPSKT